MHDCRQRAYFGQEEEGATSACIGMLLPEVEEFRGHDGRRDEAQTQEARHSNELHLL